MKYIATGFLIVLDPEPCVHGPDHKECVDFIYPISPQLREAQPSYLISLKDTVHQSSKFRHLFELYRAKLEKDDLYGPDLQRIKKEILDQDETVRNAALRYAAEHVVQWRNELREGGTLGLEVCLLDELSKRYKDSEALSGADTLTKMKHLLALLEMFPASSTNVKYLRGQIQKAIETCAETTRLEIYRTCMDSSEDPVYIYKTLSSMLGAITSQDHLKLLLSGLKRWSLLLCRAATGAEFQDPDAEGHWHKVFDASRKDCFLKVLDTVPGWDEQALTVFWDGAIELVRKGHGMRKVMMELEDLIGEKANEDPLKHKLDEKLEPAVKANTDWHITMVKFSGKFCNDAALDDKLHSVVSYYRAMAPRVTSAVGECSEAVLSSLAEKFCGFAEPLSEWNRGHHKDQNKDWSDGFDGDCFDDLLDWAEKTLLHAKVDEFMPIHKKAKAVPQYT